MEQLREESKAATKIAEQTQVQPMKDPKKIEASKRMAQWNHEIGKSLKFSALTIISSYVDHLKKTLVNQSNEASVHQPTETLNKFNMV